MIPVAELMETTDKQNLPRVSCLFAVISMVCLVDSILNLSIDPKLPQVQDCSLPSSCFLRQETSLCGSGKYPYPPMDGYYLFTGNAYPLKPKIDGVGLKPKIDGVVFLL